MAFPRSNTPPHLGLIPSGLPSTPLSSDQSLGSVDSIEFIIDPEDYDPDPHWLTGSPAPTAADYAGNSSTRSSVSAASSMTEMGTGLTSGGVERALDAYWSPAGVASPVPIVRRNSTPNCAIQGANGLSVSEGLMGRQRSEGAAGPGFGVPRMLGGRLVPGLNRLEQRIADQYSQDINDFNYHDHLKPAHIVSRSHNHSRSPVPEIPPYAPKAHPTSSNSPKQHNHQPRNDRRGSTHSTQYAILKSSQSPQDHIHSQTHLRQDHANALSLEQLQRHFGQLLSSVHALQAEQAVQARVSDTALYRMDSELATAKGEASMWRDRATQTEQVVAELEARVRTLEGRLSGGAAPSEAQAAAEKQANRERLRLKFGDAPVGGGGLLPLLATINAPPVGIRTGPSSPRKEAPPGQYHHQSQNRQPRRRQSAVGVAPVFNDPWAQRGGGVR